MSYYEELHNGLDFTIDDNKVIKNEELTIAGMHAKSYAYCADTIYNEEIAEKVKGVDLLYHEATYLKDLAERAKSRFHCTSEEAARIAKKAEAKKLLMGHFSSKYESLNEFLGQACPIFPNTELAIEGVTYMI